MIKLYVLEEVIKIWMNEHKATGDADACLTEGGSKEGVSFQKYELRNENGTKKSAFITVYKNGGNVDFYTISFDDQKNEVLSVHLDNVVFWMNGNEDLGDDPVSTSFTNDEIKSLKEMIINAEDVMAKHHKANPKYDEDNKITILQVEFEEHKTTIVFTADNRKFDRSHRLYVGFSKVEGYKEIDYVFKVNKKKIYVGLTGYAYINLPSTTEYTATFHGYFKPDEEDILNTTFGWVVSKDVINQANKEACYT